MKKSFFNFLSLLVLILPICLTLFANKNQIKSADPISLKDQLSNSQLSFFARLSSYSGSILTISTSGSPSNTTANLAAGDTLAIADIGVTTSTQYIVQDIGNTATIELTALIGSTTPSAYVIATRSAIHTVSFIPTDSVSIGETWQFLIKASSTEIANDGMPDQGGFDLGGGAGPGLGTRLTADDVTCPFSGTASVGTTVTYTSGVGASFNGSYHIIQCTAGATSNVGVGVSMIVGRALTAGSQLINPSPSTGHVLGQADISSFAIRKMTGSSVDDIKFGKIASTDNVRVTAIIDPTITFTVGTSNSTNVGDLRCGNPLSSGASNTTSNSISFGSLVLGSINNLSQSFSCVTNAQNGYVVQVYENQPLTMIGTTTTIPDTTCPSAGGCSISSAVAWTTYDASGFGYSLEVGSTSSGTTLGISSTALSKPFGIGYANAATIMSRTSAPTTTDSAYICYKTAASTTQSAGTYENSISFIATATF